MENKDKPITISAEQLTLDLSGADGLSRVSMLMDNQVIGLPQRDRKIEYNLEVKFEDKGGKALTSVEHSSNKAVTSVSLTLNGETQVYDIKAMTESIKNINSYLLPENRSAGMESIANLALKNQKLPTQEEALQELQNLSNAMNAFQSKEHSSSKTSSNPTPGSDLLQVPQPNSEEAISK